MKCLQADLTRFAIEMSSHDFQIKVFRHSRTVTLCSAARLKINQIKRQSYIFIAFLGGGGSRPVYIPKIRSCSPGIVTLEFLFAVTPTIECTQRWSQTMKKRIREFIESITLAVLRNTDYKLRVRNMECTTLRND